MNELHGQGRPSATSERLIMAANACFHVRQTDGGVFAHAAEQVKRDLRVVNTARYGLEVEQVHRLLMQLVHGGAAELAGRLKNRGGGKSDRSGLLQPIEQQGDAQ